MDPSNSSITVLIDQPAERRKRLRRLIIAIVLISVGVHLLAGVGAGIWVIARYFAQPKAQFVVQNQVKMKPEDREHRLQMEEVTSLRPKPVYNNRIQSLRPSKLALPALPKVPLDTITPIDTESLISDQIDGMGKYGNGSGSGGGFFGGQGVAGSGLLAGTLYDLKRDSNGKDTVMVKEAVGKNEEGGVIGDPAAQTAYLDVIDKLSRSGSTDVTLGKFFKAPGTLFLSKIAIPTINADKAPKEFKVADKVKPRYWVAVYKGRATAPDSGSYKFVGAADDILLVKIDNRLVFDGSIDGAQNSSRLHSKEGVTFTVEKGKAYDIEIILGEAPGGRFRAALMLQKQGTGEAPYWFRMSDDDIDIKNSLNPVNGPIWRPASKKINPAGIGL